MCSESSRIKVLHALASIAAGVLLAPMAMAQESASSTTYSDKDGTPEIVTVTPPRHMPARSTIGAPIEEVSISVPVSYGDLNLHTGEGVYTLRQRVKQTAHNLCDKLSFRYPIGTPDNDGCYRRAIKYAMPQTDSAVWNYHSPSTM
jgi:UrcA family protein